MASPKEILPINGAPQIPHGDPTGLSRGINAEDIIGLRGERTYLEKWKNYPARIQKYDAGVFPSGTATPEYRYPDGEILFINGHAVMGTCERPWAETNVRKAVEHLSRKRYESPLHPPLLVVQGGFGLGLESDEWINQMYAGAVHNTEKGGELIVLELNQKNAEYGNRRLERKTRTLRADIAQSRGLNLELNAEVVQIDALEGLKAMKERIDTGVMRKPDVISLDLFDPDQRLGTTDLLYMDLVRDCLSDDGVFTFFAYNGETGAALNDYQKRILQDYQFLYSSASATVSPPPQYEYLFRPDANGVKQPVRELMVTTAWKNPKSIKLQSPLRVI